MSNPLSTPDPASPSGAAPKKGRCPRCGKSFEYTRVAEHKPFPFCSARCRDVDLGNWLTGRYVIPGQPLPAEPSEEAGGEGHDGT